jgi:hypothetical protein
MVGQYTLTLGVGSECAVIPAGARNRSYTATIDSSIAGSYVVTLSDAFFLTGEICGSGRVCNRFAATREGGVVRVQVHSDDPNDESDTGEIWEMIPPGTWLQVQGGGAGRLEGSSIVASLEGSLWYCPGPSIPCPSFVACRSNAIGMTFMRK